MEIGEPLSERELFPEDLLKSQEEAFQRDVDRLLERRSEFVEVLCPACGTGKRGYAFSKFGLDYQKCLECRTLYVSPRPSLEVLISYYENSENYQIWASQAFPATEAARREKVYRPWLERVKSFAYSVGSPRGLLVEVGPGFGTFAELVKDSDLFERVVVIEPTPELASACRARGLEVLEAPIEEVGASSRLEASMVVAFEVIEHLYDPQEFLGAARHLLAPGGYLTLSCPNGLGFDVAELGALSQAVDAEHLNLFNPASIGVLLRRTGFTLVDVSTPGRLDAEIVREAALANALPLSPFLQRVLIDEWESLGWPFQQFLAENGLSSHMWVVARRSI